VPVAELIRHTGISEQTFYGWKKHYVGLEVDQVRQLKQVQEENVCLKRLVTEADPGQNASCGFFKNPQSSII
jgi:putative transposase